MRVLFACSLGLWLAACAGATPDAPRDASATDTVADTRPDTRDAVLPPDALHDAPPDASDVASEADAPDPRVDPPAPTGPYAGFAVLGNGRVSAAYSEAGGADGLAHLFVGSFAFDAVEAGRTRLSVDGVEVVGGTVGLEPFFAAFRRVELPGGGYAEWRAFVGEADALVVQGVVTTGAPTPRASCATPTRAARWRRPTCTRRGPRAWGGGYRRISRGSS
jgi:hypothetical protein